MPVAVVEIVAKEEEVKNEEVNEKAKEEVRKGVCPKCGARREQLLDDMGSLCPYCFWNPEKAMFYQDSKSE